MNGGAKSTGGAGEEETEEMCGWGGMSCAKVELEALVVSGKVDIDGNGAGNGGAGTWMHCDSCHKHLINPSKEHSKLLAFELKM